MRVAGGIHPRIKRTKKNRNNNTYFPQNPDLLFCFLNLAFKNCSIFFFVVPFKTQSAFPERTSAKQKRSKKVEKGKRDTSLTNPSPKKHW